MALPLESTLADLTGELLTLVGQGGLGVASAALEARAQATIRRAQKLVNLEANWTINRRRLAIALDANATEFDWPDDTAPGYVESITARKTADNKYEWNLTGGITAEDRTSWAYGGFSTVVDVPFKYSYHDGIIEVGPASSSAVTLFMTYVLGAASMVSPGDRPNCDAEAVLLRAEIVLRNQLGGSYREAIPECEVGYQRYLGLIKVRQGEDDMLVIGADWAFQDMARRTMRDNQQRHWAFRTRRP